MISVPDEEGDLQFFSHKLVSAKREEQPPVIVKTLKTTLVERSFKKELSVFKDWREDQDDTALTCIEHDLQLWNAEKFIKDEEDRENTMDALFLHLPH